MQGQKKTLIKHIPVKPCGEDNLLSLSQIAKLADYSRIYRLHANNSIKYALREHLDESRGTHADTLPPRLNVLTPGGHLLVLFSSSIIYL